MAKITPPKGRMPYTEAPERERAIVDGRLRQRAYVSAARLARSYGYDLPPELLTASFSGDERDDSLEKAQRRQALDLVSSAEWRTWASTTTLADDLAAQRAASAKAMQLAADREAWLRHRVAELEAADLAARRAAWRVQAESELLAAQRGAA